MITTDDALASLCEAVRAFPAIAWILNLFVRALITRSWG
ncbi:hypothetical protein HUSEC_10154 [Escherichia coli O104:H4 str. LB226692]|uniref:Ribonuclease D n=1 Tax=Escherichia coli ISC7 TaxID=1432555 RepID=W1EYN7_ECOLX|nr:hypothetical protein HUSEC_10154 [Escherichia coli O104:H4 str. LB226692]CDL27211.1 Ribonuclease D [Escherichia coli ISC7]